MVILKAASTLWGVSDFREEDAHNGHYNGIDEAITFTQPVFLDRLSTGFADFHYKSQTVKDQMLRLDRY